MSAGVSVYTSIGGNDLREGNEVVIILSGSKELLGGR